MNLFDAFLNAAAVWFVLKAFEVAPFAVYDLFVLTRQRFSETEDRSTYQTRHNRCFDKHRGILDFIFSGTGFLQFSSCRRSKRLFLIASLVPVLIFVLEIFSIFLGKETRTCQTSRDPNVVKAPSLQLFGEGEREVSAIDLSHELIDSQDILRPCLRRHWTYSGVEYVASMCSDLRHAMSARILANVTLPEIEGMSIGILKSGAVLSNLRFVLLKTPSGDPSGYAALLGIVFMVSDVLVNGKSVLHKNVTEEIVIDETVTEQIRNDVRILENFWNTTPVSINETATEVFFDVVDHQDIIAVLRTVVFAFMSQSRRVGLKTAAEMSLENTDHALPELDISCQEDFFLPRTVAIIIIVTAAMSRLLLLTMPTPMSSAEYALLHSEKEEETFFTAFTAEPSVTDTT